MKVYTKTGDKGTTSLIGGKRVPKNHLRIEAYGTIDELIAHVGVVRDHYTEEIIAKELIEIQDHLMSIAAILATDCDGCDAHVPKLSIDEIVWLEKKIDRMDIELPPLTQFVLPGGRPAVSYTHVARTVCRRAERCVLTLAEGSEVPMELIQFLNRLSDYLFVLARYISKELNAEEIPWQARLDK